MLKLGWKAGPEQYPPVELLDYAVMAEQAGFDAIDVSDHFPLVSTQVRSGFVAEICVETNGAGILARMACLRNAGGHGARASLPAWLACVMLAGTDARAP